MQPVVSFVSDPPHRDAKIGFGVCEGDNHGSIVFGEKKLKESSVDIYSALRSGFYQNREAEIWDRREHRRPQ